VKPRDEERSTRIRVKQRESWEGAKGNLDENPALYILGWILGRSTVLLNWVMSTRALYSRKLVTG